MGRSLHVSCSLGRTDYVSVRARGSETRNGRRLQPSERGRREKAKLDELTFALTADVTEAHRQVPVHPDEWHLLGCQVALGSEVSRTQSVHLGSHRRPTTGLGSRLLWVDSCSTLLGIRRPRGICLLLTMISSSLVGESPGVDCHTSLFSARLSEPLCHGTKPVEAIRWSRSSLNSCSVRGVLVYRQDVRLVRTVDRKDRELSFCTSGVF